MISGPVVDRFFLSCRMMFEELGPSAGLLIGPAVRGAQAGIIAWSSSKKSLIVGAYIGIFLINICSRKA